MNLETPICLAKTNGRRHGALSLITRILPEEFFFVDVGAYVGDFAAALLEGSPRARGMLFEPTEQSMNALKRRLGSKPAIKIFDIALSDEIGLHDFFIASDAPTNSLLDFRSSGSLRQKISVRVDTLDRVLRDRENSSPIALIKIDTQGNDLRVLRGAEDTISNYQPVILVEVIFISLYTGQGSYFDIFDFMKQHDYELAGIFESHCTQEGLIAFADLLFVPQRFCTMFGLSLGHQHKYLCTDASHLISQNEFLQTTCDERLELIQKLTAVAEERQAIIEVLDAEVKKLSGGKKH